MAIGKRLLLFSPRDPKANSLAAATSEWGCLVTTAEHLDDLRGKLEGCEFDYVLIEDARVLRKLVGDADPGGDVMRASIADIEKRHILRVLHYCAGNKTRAAHTLGIDTKTLYNKLKSYGALADAARRRAQGSSLGS